MLQGIITKKNYLKFLQDGTARHLFLEGLCCTDATAKHSDAWIDTVELRSDTQMSPSLGVSTQDQPPGSTTRRVTSKSARCVLPRSRLTSSGLETNGLGPHWSLGEKIVSILRLLQGDSPSHDRSQCSIGILDPKLRKSALLL